MQPIATAGIVLVFIIFVLLQREDLRDRMIRLFGMSDVHRATAAISDAAKRIGRYLLMQLVVNLLYGIPVGVGLYLIGVPNALLWGLLATVLRFVPYLGPILAAVCPIALSLAVDPELDHAAADRGPVRRARAVHQQCARALAVWRQHRPVAAGADRGRRVLDDACGGRSGCCSRRR